MVSKNGKRIVIEPVTRVEGHGKVTILMDEQNRVTQARLHIVEFRGFERYPWGCAGLDRNLLIMIQMES